MASWLGADGVTIGNRHSKALLRSLAEREAGRPATPCWGAYWESEEPARGASDGIELALQQRAEGVEVAALSALLGTQFEAHKREILQKAETEAWGVINVRCQGRESASQQRLAIRLVKYAKDLRRARPDNPPIANEDRLKMLGELLDLQETASRLIQAALGTLQSYSLQHPGEAISLEAAHEFAEEMKRIVYIRRSQVFMSKHLSHLLLQFEASRLHGRLLRVKHPEDLREKPQMTLEELRAELTDPSTWFKNPLYTTQKPPKGESRAQQEPQNRHSAAPTSDQATKTPDGGRPPLPGHSTGQASFSDRREGEEQAQKSQAEVDSSNPEQTQQTSGGISPPSEAQSLGAAQALPHQAPATLAPA
ncbi:hypothetical protein EMWEY_00057450, partial [Eimeria maxima]